MDRSKISATSTRRPTYLLDLDAPLLALAAPEAVLALTAAELRVGLEVPHGIASTLSRLADGALVAELPVAHERLGGGKGRRSHNREVASVTKAYAFDMLSDRVFDTHRS